MWIRQNIKAEGKAAFRANYWKNVIVSLLLSLLGGGAASSAGSQVSSDGAAQQTEETLDRAAGFLSNADPAVTAALVSGVLVICIVSLLLKIFLFNPLKVGCYQFFKENLFNSDTKLDVIREGFTQYGRNFLTLFLTDLYTLLWCLLLIVPGLIKAYSYRLVPYLLKDEPDLAPGEVITLSRQLMNGHKWAAFVFDLSFIGWELLGALTLGLVDIFWTRPYKNNADAALYYAIRNSQ